MAKPLLIVTLLITGIFAGPSIAQILTSIAPDGTLGTNVTTTGSTFNIEGGVLEPIRTAEASDHHRPCCDPLLREECVM